MNLRRKLDEIRKDLSYEELSKDILRKTGCNIHFTTLQKWATGKRSPSWKNIMILSRYSGKSCDWFYEEMPDEEDQQLTKIIAELSPEKQGELFKYAIYLREDPRRNDILMAASSGITKPGHEKLQAEELEQFLEQFLKKKGLLKDE